MNYAKETFIHGRKFFSESADEDKKVIMTEPTNEDSTGGGELLMNVNGSIYPSPSSPFPNDDINSTLDYVPYGSRPETYIVPVLFAIIFIIGVIGNGTLIVIFIKHRAMRNVPNMFIVSLAIGDLLVILFCVPFTSTVYTVPSWPYGLVVCKFSEFIKDLSVGVSVFTLTALSADRYVAIVDPMRKLTGRRATRITIISIIGIWTLSIIVAMPSALYSYIRVFSPTDEMEEKEDEERGEVDVEGEDADDDKDEEEYDARAFQVCYPYPLEFGPAYAQAMVMFHFLVYYAVPLFFIATFYIIMARHLVLSTRNMPGEATGQAKQIQARKKVAKMILSFVVIFAICFFPHHLFLLWFYFYPDSENHFNTFWNICRIVGFCLSFTNSCINPITLYCVSGTFRKQFNEHLFCCICDESGNRPSRSRLSGGGGGTLPGGDRGGRGGGGLCAACVSLSGNNGQLYGNDSRYGNGGRGGNGRIHRGSASNSDRHNMSKRKSTHWETQTTVVNQNRLNLGGGANIHVNLCSEHQEHIPLRSMSMSAVGGGSHQQKSPGAVMMTTSADGGSVEGQQQVANHCRLHGAPTLAASPSFLSSNYARGRRHSESGLRGGCGEEKVAKFNSRTTPEVQVEGHHLSKGVSTFPRGRVGSTIDEVSREEESSKSGHSPTKSHAKVGEIFAKIRGSRSSPNHHHSKQHTTSSESGSSPSRKSPTKLASIPAALGSYERNEEEMNYNNNNYTDSNTLNKSSPLSESSTGKQVTLPSPQGDEPLGSNLGSAGNSVIICYN